MGSRRREATFAGAVFAALAIFLVMVATGRCGTQRMGVPIPSTERAPR